MTMKRILIALFALSCLTIHVALAEDKDPTDWDHSLALGGSLTSGNSDTLNANFAAGSTRDTELMDTRLGIDVNYGETKFSAEDGTDFTETSVQNGRAFANVKRKRGTAYVYGDTTAFHDEIALVDYRINIGVGAGGFLINNDVDKLSLEAGVGYMWEDISTEDQDDFTSIRAAGRYDHTFSADAKLWVAVEGMTRRDGFAEYLINSEIGTEAKLNASVALRLVLQDRYNSDPAEGVENRDSTLIAGISVTL